ncbi:hypothetical protein [Christiangramia sp.]|uniref:hypothetical protein n=1 Tax=Christiangramia sp. TaxID=1931228 RepID=UPI0026171F26|nr:hypothetical protein [Christiangramia sp.]
MKGKYLITTDSWFTAPDGKDYRAIWGDVEIVSDEILGVKTNARSANWYAKVGSEDTHVIIAGCQIHYAIKSEKRPNTDGVTAVDYENQKFADHLAPNKIYIAEAEKLTE